MRVMRLDLNQKIYLAMIARLKWSQEIESYDAFELPVHLMKFQPNRRENNIAPLGNIDQCDQNNNLEIFVPRENNYKNKKYQK